MNILQNGKALGSQRVLECHFKKEGNATKNRTTQNNQNLYMYSLVFLFSKWTWASVIFKKRASMKNWLRLAYSHVCRTFLN